MMKVEGRRLEEPQITYQQPKLIVGGLWNLRGVVFQAPVEIKRWILVCNDNLSTKQFNEVDLLERSIIKEWPKYGLRVPNKLPILERNITRPDLLNGLVKGAVEHARGLYENQDPQLLMFVLPRQNTHTYNLLKTICDTQYGIASQIFDQQKLYNKNETTISQYLGNIALKVNVKLGGLNCHVKEEFFCKIRKGEPKNPRDPRSQLIYKDTKVQPRTMIVGGDITHGPATAVKPTVGHSSYSALVGTYDLACTRYTAVTSRQQAMEVIDKNGKKTKELDKRFGMIHEFEQMLKVLCRRFREKNNKRKCPPATSILTSC